jgi:EH domain-containing protein 1
VRTDNNQLGEEIFEKEQSDLKKDLLDVPRRSCDRKVNEFVKRVRACVTHAKLIAHLRKQMPLMAGHAEKQKKLLDNIENEFQQCVHEHAIPRGDMPNPKVRVCISLPPKTVFPYNTDTFFYLSPAVQGNNERHSDLETPQD